MIHYDPMKLRSPEWYEQGWAKGDCDHSSEALRSIVNIPARDILCQTLSLRRLHVEVKQAEILELGCGEGWFADQVEPYPWAKYILGVDVSGTAISRARTRCPGARFEVVDGKFDTFRSILFRETYNTFVALDVLEHLDDDLEPIAWLDAGTIIVFSVPSFRSESHVRTYATWPDIIERFGSSVSISAAFEVVDGPRTWRVVGGIRR